MNLSTVDGSDKAPRPRRLAASAGGGIAACGSSASGGSTTGSSADGKSFYEGKTITWDVPDPPGTGFYTTATILAPALGKYLNATVNIVSIPAGGRSPGRTRRPPPRPTG